MSISFIREEQRFVSNEKIKVKYEQFNRLISLANEKEMPSSAVEKINQEIEEINSSAIEGGALRMLLIRKQRKTIKVLEKEAKLVPKGYYRTLWMIIGMTAFGLPVGVAFGFMLRNMSYIGTGIPIGMVIGMAYGTKQDTKAHNEGRQLDIDAY